MQMAEVEMRKCLDKFKSELQSYRTGRAHVSILEGIKAEYFGSFVPLTQVATISITEARTFELKPWDPEGLKAIEQAILKSDLGLTPMNDGKVIRLNLPAPTEERKKEIIRVVHKLAEDFRVNIRNVRRECVESLKKSEKEKKISKDELHRSEQTVQKTTDHYIKLIDESLLNKEKEILEN